MVYKLFIALLSFFFATTLAAKPPLAIQWQTFHFPPLYMKQGPFEGQGYMDQTLALLIASMPDFEHHLPLTTHTRALADIREGKPACHPALFKTAEREAYALFSMPSLITPANRFIVSKQTLLTRKIQEPVDLSTVLLEHQLSVAVIANRVYGERIDRALDTYVEDNILKMPIAKSAVIFQLLYRDRIDAAIAFPFELRYFETTHNAEGKMLAMVIENMVPYAVGYIACPNTAWGHNVIEAVNRALAKLVHTEAYMLAMTSWWREELDKPEFTSFYQQALLAEYVD